MRTSTFRASSAGLLLLAAAAVASAHGLVQSPPARNWFCGAITKPDHVLNGTAQYPVCGDAFGAPGIDFTDGYSFMSVLTHTQGHAVLGDRPNVCGFGSETWNGRATVWDQPINWPTSNISAGPQLFTWSISWGPHFSDTEEFRYWITKPGFQFQVGVPLSFDDFDDDAFCVLRYNDATPTANPDVIPNVAAATFQTRCNVPQRAGRHVIYAEWGRNQATFERFHGCIDVVFQGGGSPVAAQIATVPAATEFTGSGQIALDGRGSQGSGLSYQWSVTAPNPGLYSISGADQAQAVLTLDDPPAAESFTIALVVSNAGGSSSATRTILHRPATASPWLDLGPVISEAQARTAGDRVSVRTVSQQGQDAFWPASPLVLSAANSAAAQWPLALAQAVNTLNGAVRIGVLSGTTVTPVADATANRVFAMVSANIVSAFLQIVPAAVPPAPTGLSAAAGDARAQLAWTATPGATSYNVKRSLTSGGPYANVATGVTSTAFTNTGLANGTTYFYVVTALNASGESPISNQAAATPQAAPSGVTITPVVSSSSPWFNEEQVRITNPGPLTALSVTIVVQRTAGITASGQYNTVGGQITQSVSSTAAAATYTFTLGAGQTLTPGTARIFAAQTGGNGAVHPTAGDAYTVTYTSGGVTASQSGHF